MEKQIRISIIMPVYKVEEYVAKAIESILNQTMEDFEFLIVDDGTPDRSGEICDEYAQKDSRIQVIHKTNSGAPSARNQAIDMATGKYLYFLDSDDWTEPEMLEDLYDLAEEYCAQLVISGFYIDTYYGKGKYIKGDYVPKVEGFLEKEEFRKNAYKLFDNNMLYPPWNKLYLREYIEKNQLYFPNTMWDDFPFNLSVIRDIERVCVTQKQYYHFLRARSESETARYLPTMYEKREEEHQWMKELYQYWHIDECESEEVMARRYIDRLIGCFENLTNLNCTLNKREKQQKILQMLQNKEVKECLAVARPRTLYAKLMYLPIKWSNVHLIYAEAKVITFIKTKNTKMFSILKSRR